MYNTLDDKTQYLKKEVDLLDSIYDNFETARATADNMSKYLRQFEKIVEGVKMNKIKVSYIHGDTLGTIWKFQTDILFTG